MNNNTTIKSNRHTRDLVGFFDLPASERDDFDYVEGEEQYSLRFFSYRGSWYDYFEFEVAPDSFKARGWDGVQTESYFSAVLVSYFDRDGYELEDQVIVGYAHW